MKLHEYFEVVVQKTQCIKALATTFCEKKPQTVKQSKNRKINKYMFKGTACSQADKTH